LVPPEVSYRDATYIEPLADCLYGLYVQALLKPGERVLILGAGVMGQLLALCARLVGVELTVAEPNPVRAEIAKISGGRILPHAVSDAASFKDEADQYDLVACSIGTEDAIRGALASTRKGGRVLLFGGFPKGSSQQLDLNEVHYREVTIVGSHWVGVGETRASLACYPAAIRLITQGLVPVANLTTDVFELGQFAEALDRAASQDALKVILEPRL
jgi:threonine dehydrogenase-like Zn-dependent dehydrogenase